jgi:hypothetical protein
MKDLIFKTMPNYNAFIFMQVLSHHRPLHPHIIPPHWNLLIILNYDCEHGHKPISIAMYYMFLY